MDWKLFEAWAMANLHYIVPVASFPLIFWFMARNKHPKSRNDATPYIIKQKKQMESINQRSKGMMIK